MRDLPPFTVNLPFNHYLFLNELPSQFYKNQKSKHELFLCWLCFRKLSSNLSPFWIVAPFEFLIGSGQNISKKHPTDSEWRKLLLGHWVPNTFIGPTFLFRRKEGVPTRPKFKAKYLCPWVCIPRLWDSHRFRSEILCKAVRNDYVAPDESTVESKLRKKCWWRRGEKHTKSRLVTVEWIPIPKIQRKIGDAVGEIVRPCKMRELREWFIDDQSKISRILGSFW